jgi:hypothetical protein
MATKRPYKLRIEYDGGIDPEMDRRIFEAVGYSLTDADEPEPRVTSDSGCMLVGEHTRDHAFYFNDPVDAAAAEYHAKRIGGLRVWPVEPR